jgi:signal transduction histidine kinase
MVRRSVRFSTQVLVMQLGVLVVVCGAGLGFMRTFLRDELIQEHEQRALSIARAVAADGRYGAAVVRHDMGGEVQTLAEAARRSTAALFVVVTDERGVRYSHPDPTLIGKSVAADQAQALSGREVVTFAPSAVGLSARGKVPLRDTGGHVVGQVIVAIEAREINDRLMSLLQPAAVFIVIALAAGTAVAIAFTRRTKRQTFGLGPVGLRQLLDQQAALRRVATLVAAGASPNAVLTAVATEVGDLLHAETTTIVRREPDATNTVVARAGDHDGAAARSGGSAETPMVLTEALATGRPARRDVNDPEAEPAGSRRHAPMRSSVAAPIVVDGRLWGAIGVAAKREDFGPDTGERIAEFTELVAMAIANAESRAQLTASRARVVAAADQSRRRIERDLHDGTQQRLVSLALELRGAESAVPPDQPALTARLGRAASGLAEAVENLQEISRGIHPAVLSRGGLAPALKALVRRSGVAVDLRVEAEDRLPEPVEVAVYYVVSEALTNAAKYAEAKTVRVTLKAEASSVHVVVEDDGVGGADPANGSGLIGLSDRVEALGGRIVIMSPPGSGTSLDVTIPLDVD